MDPRDSLTFLFSFHQRALTVVDETDAFAQVARRLSAFNSNFADIATDRNDEDLARFEGISVDDPAYTETVLAVRRRILNEIIAE